MSDTNLKDLVFAKFPSGSELDDTCWPEESVDFDEEEQIEQHRAGEIACEPLFHGNPADIVLREGDATVKMVEKSRSNDEALFVLDLLMSGSNVDKWMRQDKKRWIHSSKETEYQLAIYLLSGISKKPSITDFTLRRLNAQDAFELLHRSLKSVIVSTPTIVRLRMKFAVNMEEIMRWILELQQVICGLTVTDCKINARYFDNETQTHLHNLVTTDVEEYAKLEAVLEDSSRLMTCTVRATLRTKEATHQTCTVVYENVMTHTRERSKRFEIHQSVGLQRRRVGFALDTNIVHEYELPDDALMVPLKNSIPQDLDLIEFLQNLQLGQTSL